MNISPLKFVGRVSLINDLKTEITSGTASVLTLHGYGGIGKTRLANEVVSRVAADFEASAHSVALDNEPWENPLSVTPEQLAGVIARSIGAPDTVTQKPEDRLLAHLQGQKQTLILLDNWESAHNPETVKWIAKAVNAASQVRWIITSRNILGITNAERVFEIAPMDL